MSKYMLDMAIMQFVGFRHAKQGYDVEQLCRSMGLTKTEFDKIKNDVAVAPYAKDIEQLFSEEPSC